VVDTLDDAKGGQPSGQRLLSPGKSRREMLNMSISATDPSLP
jgi:hypothetical protein